MRAPRGLLRRNRYLERTRLLFRHVSAPSKEGVEDSKDKVCTKQHQFEKESLPPAQREISGQQRDSNTKYDLDGYLIGDSQTQIHAGPSVGLYVFASTDTECERSSCHRRHAMGDGVHRKLSESSNFLRFYGKRICW